MRNVLVATTGERKPGGLEHLGDGWRVHTNNMAGWANASNALLDRAANLGGDVLFLDDDVTLTETSLDGVRAHYDAADLFGLDLHDLAGERQQGARHTMTLNGIIADWVESGPAYVAHCSTSAIYIKEGAVRAGLRFPIWPGIHWEDVALCLDAWLMGFKVLAVPGVVQHAIEGGVGSTKRHTPEFWERWRVNMDALSVWTGERNVRQALIDGVIPSGAKPL